jgi:hypothetical protein
MSYDLDQQMDFCHVSEDEPFDGVAQLEEFPGKENVSFKQLPPPDVEVYYPIGGGQHGTIPNPIVFWGMYEDIDRIDYPYTDKNWALMSKRMLNTLLSVQDFPHRTFPVNIVDDQFIGFEGEDKIFRVTTNQNFVIVQLTTHLDVFDWENSEYTLLEGVPGRVERAKKVVLKEPSEGFPPLFQIAAYESRLFVSHAGKTALEAAHITGTKFIPLEKVYF